MYLVSDSPKFLMHSVILWTTKDLSVNDILQSISDLNNKFSVLIYSRC